MLRGFVDGIIVSSFQAVLLCTLYRSWSNFLCRRTIQLDPVMILSFSKLPLFSIVVDVCAVKSGP